MLPNGIADNATASKILPTISQSVSCLQLLLPFIGQNTRLRANTI